MKIHDDTGRELVASDARIPFEDAAFLRAVLEAVPAFILRLDPDRRINYINHLRPGVTPAEVIGSQASDYILPESRERFDAAVDQALSTGQQSTFEVKATYGDRKLFFEGRVVPIEHGDGRMGVCAVVLDVTRRETDNSALAASEEKLRIAVEATGIGLWSWDAESDQLEWSQRMVEIAGQSVSRGREYVERVVHPDDRARVRRDFRLVEGDEPRLSMHRIVQPSGEVRWVMPCVRRIEANEGRLRLSGGTLDVTAQRAMDERLRESQKLDAVGSLTAGVAHNFNNMLAVILPALDLAASGASGREGQIFSDAAQAARRAAELVKQLMTFAGQYRDSTAKLHDVAELVARAVSMCRRTFERQEHIEVRLAQDCPPVMCDGAAIEQVIINLMINARDALTEADRVDPCITIELTRLDDVRPDPALQSGDYVCVSVEDNGTGMSPAVMRRLFEPFFTTKGPDRGTGLGLATSYGIARDHDGCIAFESELGRGTTARLFLPIGDHAALAASRPKAAAAPTQAARASTILVVDDEPALRRMMSSVLRPRGHEVVLAADARSALRQLDGGLQPDLILLDHSMPGLRLKQALAEMRQRRVSVPIVLFTGQEVTAEERASVQDVLYKPLALEDLVQSVEKWLGQAEG